jgi:hypothetical protein
MGIKNACMPFKIEWLDRSRLKTDVQLLTEWIGGEKNGVEGRGSLSSLPFFDGCMSEFCSQ